MDTPTFLVPVDSCPPTNLSYFEKRPSAALQKPLSELNTDSARSLEDKETKRFSERTLSGKTVQLLNDKSPIRMQPKAVSKSPIRLATQSVEEIKNIITAEKERQQELAKEARFQTTLNVFLAREHAKFTQSFKQLQESTENPEFKYWA